VLALRELRYVGGGIAQGDELAPIWGPDRIIEVAVPAFSLVELPRLFCSRFIDVFQRLPGLPVDATAHLSTRVTVASSDWGAMERPEGFPDMF
jgi:hypothetical protein